MQIIINDTDACWAEVLDVLSGARVKVEPGVPAEQYFGLRDALVTDSKPLNAGGVQLALHTTPPGGVAPVAPPADAAQITLDAQGIPWDQRIHAISKAKTADGNWRVKRNVAPELVAQITAELKGAMGLPTPAPAPVVAPPAPPAPVAPPPPPAAPAIVVDPFNDLVTYITGRQAAKTITAAKVMEVVKAQGFESLMTLAQRPDLIPTLRAALEKVTG